MKTINDVRNTHKITLGKKKKKAKYPAVYSVGVHTKYVFIYNYICSQIN